MKIRRRFLLLFALQALATAFVSAVFAFSAIVGADIRAEGEMGAIPSTSGQVFDSSRPEGERLEAAIAEAQALRARSAAMRLYRSQAAVEAAVSIGIFSILWAGAAAILFAIGSRSFTRRLDELSAGARLARADRGFRFRRLDDPEFGPVFDTFNETFDRLGEQERRLGEAARLDGWREVSSFLFHQLKTPLSSIEMAVRNVQMAARGGGRSDPSGRDGPERRALEACGESAAVAAEECLRIRVLLDRFRSLAGLSLLSPEPVRLEEIVAALRTRVPPDRARIEVSGGEETLLVDRRMAEEALLNLLLNAAEAAQRPPATLRIEASPELGRQDGFVVLLVSDDNGAVDAGLFERAGKGRYSTKVEGTGLGLLFVRRVTAMHGGDFDCFPGPDGGFRLRLSFPRSPAREGEGS